MILIFKNFIYMLINKTIFKDFFYIQLIYYSNTL